MKNIKLLDCTLRDGGYITNWYFGNNNIIKIIKDLCNGNMDYIELGYLNSAINDKDKSIYNSIEEVSQYIPKNKKQSLFLAMVDVEQFCSEDLVKRQSSHIDGIRVVFYKHQIEKALLFCDEVVKAGFKLFVQPMVTIDYTLAEYGRLIDRIVKLDPFCVSIVDSFGYMSNNDLNNYFQILDARLNSECSIGFHSHNNMQHSILSAVSLFNYKTDRKIVIDASLYGMGRGAGNLNTELIANYYNENIAQKYNLNIFISLISDIIYPIYIKKAWGYSPYFFLTAYYHCHPNYASYLLSEMEICVNEFEEFLITIPPEMRVKCTKSNTLKLFEEYKKINEK